MEALRDCNVYIVTVPTPIDGNRGPDLAPLLKASETLGQVVGKGDVVTYDPAVYPGATEEDCLPVIERVSGLTYNQDFFAGYSPERINPGDKQHRVTNIKKVTSGSTPQVAEFVDSLYCRVITAGTHIASSIAVAEAAKVIENTQRDVNIALINELAVIFSRLGIDTEEVLEAAGTYDAAILAVAHREFSKLGVEGIRLECEVQAPAERGHLDTETLLAAVVAWGVEATRCRPQWGCLPSRCRTHRSRC